MEAQNNWVTLIAAAACLGSLGVMVLAFDALLTFVGWKQKQTEGTLKDAQTLSVAQLRPTKSLVCLRGQIMRVGELLDVHAAQPLALIRMRVEVYEYDPIDEQNNWRPWGDKIKATPFLLADPSGEVWVDPSGADKTRFLGPGSEPTPEQISDASRILDLPLEGLGRKRARYQLWELHQGDTVTVYGAVRGTGAGVQVEKPPQGPLVITGLDRAALERSQAKRTKLSMGLAIGLGVLGVLLLCCAGGSVVVGLLRMSGG